VIVASAELWPAVRSSLHRELRDRVAGVIEHDLEHATVEEIRQVLAPIIDRVEHDRERDLIARLNDALATGGAAVAGFEEVLARLEQQRVELLLIDDSVSLSAGICPQCGRLSADEEGNCRRDGSRLLAADGTEHLIARAAQLSVDVVVTHHEPDALREHGHVAALLRW
jgi:peptide subunit release factor 1 (eRF1)